MRTEEQIAEFKKEQAEKRNDVNFQYLEYRKEKLSLLPQERAKKFNIFKLMLSALEEKPQITEELRIAVYKLQKKFFEENPKRIHPDPIIFKEILKGRPLNTYVVDIIERQIQTDMRYANN